MRVVLVNLVYADGLDEPEALLDRIPALTGWSEALTNRGVEAVVVQRFHREATAVRNGVRYRFVSGSGRGRPRRWAPLGRLGSAVVSECPDVVHVNGLDQVVPVRRLRRILPATTAIVVQDHSGSVPVFGVRSPVGLARVVVGRCCLGVVDAVLFTGPGLDDPWLRAGILPRSAVHYVIEGSTTFTPVPVEEARRRSGLQGHPALLWVGHLSANKDPLTVLDAMVRVVDERPRAVLSMAYQSGGLLEAVRDRIRVSAPLQSQVRLLGSVDHGDLPLFYSAADLFVLGSRHESCGFSLIEAIACGAAPVVTDIPAFRAVTGNGSIGHLWNPGSADDCARAILDMSRDESALQRHRVVAHFSQSLSWRSIGERAEMAYRAAMAARRDRRVVN